MVCKDDDIPVYGAFGSVEYAIREDGSKPAERDLAKLKKRDRRRYARFMGLFRQLVKTGRLPKSKCDDYEGTEIRKFKHSENYPYRIPFFSIGSKHFLTHLFKKRESEAFIQGQIKKAKKIMNEHKSRIKKR